MALTKVFKPTQVLTQNTDSDRTCVITVVHWTIEYVSEENEVLSTATGVTVLPPPSPEDYTPPEDVTWGKLYDWVVRAQGGQAFIDMLDAEHTESIETDRVESASKPYAGLVPFHDPVPALRNEALHKAMRGRLGVRPAVTYKGRTYDADEGSIQRMDTMLRHADGTASLDWILADNTVAKVPVSELYVVLKMALSQQTENTLLARRAKDVILNATTIEGVEQAKGIAEQLLNKE